MRQRNEDDCGVLPSETASHGSGPRRASDVPLVEPWRDALLRLSLELPIEVHPEEVVVRFLDGLGAVLPNLALGASVVLDEGQAPIVRRRMPAGLALQPAPEGARLFPTLPEERAFPFAGAVSGCLQIACPATSGNLSPFHLQVAERAALVLGAALDRAEQYRRAAARGHTVTELRAQLVQAEKLASLGQIVAGVIHELNNPLTSILAYANHLTRRVESGAALEAGDTERLKRIAEAAERLLKLSRDLVTYARPTQEKPERFDLSEIVDKAVVFCEHELTALGVRVERTYPPGLPPLEGMPGEIVRVFVNLFTNAAHAMSAGGTLRIVATLHPDGRRVLVDVSDSGAGIPPEHLAQIFEPFFTTKHDGRGTGLGLSIVRNIVEAHGGTVRVSSTEGKGTTFRVELPVAETT